MIENQKFVNFHVKPRIPESLSPLLELAYNVWSTWDKNAYDLFSRMDPILYSKFEHNPVELITKISNDRLDELSKDVGFLYELNLVYQSYKDYLNFNESSYTYKNQKWNIDHDKRCVYLCLEYGLHESIPIYSGGLGILAGDYLKAASDQAIPMTAFGLLYKYGYFSQVINPDGMQEERYNVTNWATKPVTIVKDKKGKDLIFKITVEKQDIHIKVWKINVGKVELYLLDTDINPNTAFIKSITNMLYESDREKRILQEIVLAYGSMKVMDLIGVKPTLYHLNEGHSAFIILELLRKFTVEQGYSYDEAKELIRASTIFTTHTPVVAGNEHFDKKLVEKWLTAKITEAGLTIEKFNEIASIEDDNKNYWLPALAIRFSKYINGVSMLHAHVSRQMWNKIYPNLYQSEVPIIGITNGVHLQTWMSKQIGDLFLRYVGPEYLHASEKKSVWDNVPMIPDNEIWEAHKQRKEQMISFIRNKIIKIKQDRGISSDETNATPYLNSKYLTIGFARRFAQYKRANLLLTNPARLLNILKNKERPVQFIFAGKAHPADVEGKRLIQNIINFARQSNLEDRFLFVEGYDVNVARHIVQGCDVWLNNPIKPEEASGTSGMKAGINGVLNLSVMDGWWPECYDGKNGWEINAGDFYNDWNTKQRMEAEQIYDLIEHKIAPLYYTRDEYDYPKKWVQMMKRSIYTVGKGFNMHRMLDDYVQKFYLDAIKSVDTLTADKNKELKKIIKQQQDVASYWNKIHVKDFFIKFPDKETVYSGDKVKVEAFIQLAGAPNELFTVELVYQYDDLDNIKIIPLEYIETYDDKVAKYETTFEVLSSGSQSANVRIRPKTISDIYKECYYIKWQT